MTGINTSAFLGFPIPPTPIFSLAQIIFSGTEKELEPWRKECTRILKRETEFMGVISNFQSMRLRGIVESRPMNLVCINLVNKENLGLRRCFTIETLIDSTTSYEDVVIASFRSIKMNYCVQCGIQIPEGQRICSMCYGDIDHGTDGYYRKMVEDSDRKMIEESEDRCRSLNCGSCPRYGFDPKCPWTENTVRDLEWCLMKKRGLNE